MPSDTLAIDHSDRALEIESRGAREDTIEQAQHLHVRVRPAPEQDDARAIRLLKGDEAWVVEICRDYDASLAPSNRQQLAIWSLGQIHRRGVNGVMTRREGV